MKTLTTIHKDACAALRSHGGLMASTAAWAIWFLIEKVVNFSVLALSVTLPPLAWIPIYYFLFVKEYGTTALSVAVVRGEPRLSCAFMGFGSGWRTVGVHLWIGWKLLPSSLLSLVMVLAALCWLLGDSASAHGVLTAAKAHLPEAIVLGAFFVLLAFLPMFVAWYHYRLAYFVLVDHPDWANRKIVEESRRLMTGLRARMFRLDFVFYALLWAAALPGLVLIIQGLVSLGENPEQLQNLVQQIAQGALDTANLPAWLGTFERGNRFLFLSSLFSTVVVYPYWTTVRAAFYETVLDMDEGRKEAESATGESCADSEISENT